METAARIYIFKLKNGEYRGVTANTEEEAREIANLRGYHVEELVRTEIEIQGGYTK